MTTPGGNAPDGAYVIGSRYGQDENEAGIRDRIRGPALGGFQDAQAANLAGILREIFNTVNDDYIADLPIIQDHSHTITELVEAVNQLILQGQSIVFDSNNTYYPSAGITSIDVILIGAGGGGGGSLFTNVNGWMSGGGGGGGGEVHTSIPSSLLPKTAGAFDPISIFVGAGGYGGPAADSGQGGGNTRLAEYLSAGGGDGGTYSSSPLTALGGAGMIPGGNGSAGAYDRGDTVKIPSTLAGNSVSAYDLHGGGGGGGAGSTTALAGRPGGIGGISAGGNLGTPGGPGLAPNAIIAAGGGGGGGGGASSNGHGGAGGFPGGGGGGAGVPSGTGGHGGAGGNGRLWIIERFA